MVAAPADRLVDDSKVYVAVSPLGGAGAFAAVALSKGDLVERGIVRRIPVDGQACPFVFSWSAKNADLPDEEKVWATGSGASTFYNTGADANTEMTRFYDEDRFEIHATRDIAAGEELLHVYKSIGWRRCFAPIDAKRPRSL